MCKFTELLCKEVICLRDGRRMGFVSDCRIGLPEGRILAIVVPGRCRGFGLCPPKEDFVIPWNCVKRIGPDIVLVDIQPQECCVPRSRPLFPL